MSKSFFFFGRCAGGRSAFHDDEGHVRVTRMDHGVVGGGTKEEHERMTDLCMRVNEGAIKIHRKHGERPDPRYFVEMVREKLDGSDA